MKTASTIAFLICAFVCETASACGDMGTPADFPLNDEVSFADFVERLRRGVASDDKNAVADSLDYPVTIAVKGKQRKIDRPEFVRRYSQIMTPKIRMAISEARFVTRHDFSCLWWNWRGVMFGNGDVWVSGDNPTRSITFNN